MTADSIVVRSCHGQAELEACVALQIETWGYDPSDVIPRKAFLVWQKVGGQVIGAFDTALPDAWPQGDPASLVGFVNSLPGLKTGLNAKGNPLPPKPYLHSHMMAVKDGYRNRGLGARLKLAQRADALARGIRHMEWTFDPLEIKNAFLNIHKLGAVARTYYADFYGVSSSRLQGGLPTDRLLAEWRLDSPHVRRVLTGDGEPNARIEQQGMEQQGMEQQGIDQQGKIVERIGVPASIYEWKAAESLRGRALAVQSENRVSFQRAFERGLAVVDFTRDANGNGIYELGRPVNFGLDQEAFGLNFIELL